MSSYTEVTQQIGDQWVAAIERAREALTPLQESLGSAAESVQAQTPNVPVPESLQSAAEVLRENVPQPSEVVAANFALAERLLKAQKDFALQLLQLGAGGSNQSGAGSDKDK